MVTLPNGIPTSESSEDILRRRLKGTRSAIRLGVIRTNKADRAAFDKVTTLRGLERWLKTIRPKNAITVKVMTGPRTSMRIPLDKPRGTRLTLSNGIRVRIYIDQLS